MQVSVVTVLCLNNFACPKGVGELAAAPACIDSLHLAIAAVSCTIMHHGMQTLDHYQGCRLAGSPLFQPGPTAALCGPLRRQQHVHIPCEPLQAQGCLVRPPGSFGLGFQAGLHSHQKRFPVSFKLQSNSQLIYGCLRAWYPLPATFWASPDLVPSASTH